MTRSPERDAAIVRNGVVKQPRRNIEIRQDPPMRDAGKSDVVRRAKLNSFSTPFSLRGAIDTHLLDAVRFHEISATSQTAVTENGAACRCNANGQKIWRVANVSCITKTALAMSAESTQGRSHCEDFRRVHSRVHHDYYGGFTQHDDHQHGRASFRRGARSHKQPGPSLRPARQWTAS